jgi:hypothetical protein
MTFIQVSTNLTILNEFLEYLKDKENLGNKEGVGRNWPKALVC